MDREMVLFVGDSDYAEFQTAIQSLRGRTELVMCDDLQCATEVVESNCLFPCLVVLAEARPGQFSQRDVERLHGKIPLARLVGLLGSWCQGETCSGWPWRGVERVRWCDFPAWLLRTEREMVGGTGSWTLPRTATDAERAETLCRDTHVSGRGVVAISAGHITVFEGLAAACAQSGWTAVWWNDTNHRFVRGAMAGIWDDSNLWAADSTPLRSFVKCLAPAPVVALHHFPRLVDYQQSQCEGVQAVLAKPFLIDDLLALLTCQSSGTPVCKT